MKIRNGFVSNSSSSSFIIASKEKLTKEKLMEYFNVSEKSPLYKVAKDISKALIDMSELKTIDEIKEDYCFDDENELDECNDGIFKKAKDKDFKYLYQGMAGNDGEAIENMICEMEMNYDGDDLIIWKEGGY